LIPRIFAGYAQRLLDEPDVPRPAGTKIGMKDNALLNEAAGALSVDLMLARCIAEAGNTQ
jgi:hypothetical protein